MDDEGAQRGNEQKKRGRTSLDQASGDSPAVTDTSTRPLKCHAGLREGLGKAGDNASQKMLTSGQGPGASAPNKAELLTDVQPSACGGAAPATAERQPGEGHAAGLGVSGTSSNDVLDAAPKGLAITGTAGLDAQTLRSPPSSLAGMGVKLLGSSFAPSLASSGGGAREGLGLAPIGGSDDKLSKRSSMGWGRGLSARRSNTDNDVLQSSRSLGKQLSAVAPWEDTTWYEKHIRDLEGLESKLDSRRQQQLALAEEQEQALRGMQQRLEELSKPVKLEDIVVSDSEAASDTSDDSATDPDDTSRALARCSTLDTVSMADETAAASEPPEAVPAAASRPNSAGKQAAGAAGAGAQALEAAARMRMVDAPGGARLDACAAWPPAPDTAPRAPTCMGAVPAFASLSSKDTTVCMVLGCNRFQAARVNRRAFDALPPWLRALVDSTQHYMHRGHHVVLQKPLLRSLAGSALAARSAEQHAAFAQQLASMLRLERQEAAQRRQACAEAYVIGLQNFLALQPFPCSRSQPGRLLSARSDYDQQLQIKQLQQMVNLECFLPEQLSEAEQRRALLVDSNKLVHDPVAALEREKITRPWTADEKKLYFAAFLEHPKDFRAVAEAVRTRTAGECIKWFYQNHLKDEFNNVHRKMKLRKRRDKAGQPKMFGPLAGVPMFRDSGGRGDRDRKPSTAGVAPRKRTSDSDLLIKRPALKVSNDAFTSAVARVGKDFDALAAQLHCEPSQAKGFWKRMSKKLDLEQVAAEHLSAACAAASPGDAGATRSASAAPGSAADNSLQFMLQNLSHDVELGGQFPGLQGWAGPAPPQVFSLLQPAPQPASAEGALDSAHRRQTSALHNEFVVPCGARGPAEAAAAGGSGQMGSVAEASLPDVRMDADGSGSPAPSRTVSVQGDGDGAAAASPRGHAALSQLGLAATDADAASRSRSAFVPAMAAPQDGVAAPDGGLAEQQAVAPGSIMDKLRLMLAETDKLHLLHSSSLGGLAGHHVQASSAMGGAFQAMPGVPLGNVPAYSDGPTLTPNVIQEMIVQQQRQLMMASRHALGEGHQGGELRQVMHGSVWAGQHGAPAPPPGGAVLDRDLLQGLNANVVTGPNNSMQSMYPGFPGAARK